MHWTAGFGPGYFRAATGPPPVMCIVKCARRYAMKRTVTVAVSAALIFGLAIDAWVFTPHGWNPPWLAEVSTLPGVYLGCFLWIGLGHRDGFEVACIIAGLASEWLLIGVLAGTLFRLFQRLKPNP